MCRLYALRATSPMRVACDLLEAPNALLRQSQCDVKGECHPDGWGLVHYEGGWPQRMRGALPSFEDPAFAAAAESVSSPTVLAHVRFASVGDRSLVNTHPFLLARWVFAHNGTIAGLDRLHPELTAEMMPELAALRLGTTDSEAAFLWFMSRLAAEGIDVGRRRVNPQHLRRVFARSAAELWSRCEKLEPGQAKLNFLLTDGESLVATRINHSLHVARAAGGNGDPEVRSARIASEPIAAEGWEEVPNASVVLVDGRAEVEIDPL